MDILKKVLKRHRRKIMHLPNVIGIGEGNKTTDGFRTSERAIVVLVSKKVPRKSLKKTEIVPYRLDSVTTDVLEIGEPRLLSRTEYRRPAQPGMSIGHYLITAGTFGALVKDKKTGKPLILSNNHVLANSTNGKDGRAATGDPVLQPGPYDGGNKEQVIGYLERYIPLKRKFELPECRLATAAQGVSNRLLMTIRPNYRLSFRRRSSESNTVDAAVASPISEKFVSSEILEIGTVSGIASPFLGMTVKKSGRSSGLNHTQIKVINTTLEIKLSNDEQAVFEQQFITGPIALPGDSGSLVVDEKSRAVGLLFAGSEKVSVVNNIQNVINLLEIEI